MEPGYDAYIAGKRSRASEASRIAGLANDACCGKRSDSLDGGEKLPDLVRMNLSFDVALEITCPLAEHGDVLASVSNLQLVGLFMIPADGDFGRCNQGERQNPSNTSAAVEAKHRKFLGRDPAQRGSGRISREDGGGKFSVETAHVAGELGKGEVHGLMQMADAIAELQNSLLSQPHQLTQVLDCRFW